MALHWLGRLRSLLTPTTSHRPRTLPARRLVPSPRLEELEGRLAPATLITILPDNVALSGSLDALFLQNHGTITVNDGAARGQAPETLSKKALTTLAGNYDISITARNAIDFGLAQASLPRLGTIGLKTLPGHDARFAVDPSGSGGITFLDPTARIETQGGSLTFDTPGMMTVGDFSSKNGFINLGARQLTITGKLVAANGITLRANVLDLTASKGIDAGSLGTVTIQPFDPGQAIDLGTKTNADLARLTAAIVQIGSPDSGDITVSAAINATRFQKLSLRTGGAILQGADGLLQAKTLALAAGTGIGSDTNPLLTSVNQLAGATTTSGNIQLNNSGNLRLSGPVQTANGSIWLQTTGLLTMDPAAVVTAVGGGVTLNLLGVSTATTQSRLSGKVTGDAVQVTSLGNLSIPGTIRATSGNVSVQTFGSGTRLGLETTGQIQAAGQAIFRVDPAVWGRVALLGTVFGTSLNVNGGKGNDQLTIQCATNAPLSVNMGQGEDTVWVNVRSTSMYRLNVVMDGSAGDVLQVKDLTGGATLIGTRSSVPNGGTVTISYPAPGKTSIINFSGVRTVIPPLRSVPNRFWFISRLN